jgi:beta-N-acetylhexosaminidase
MTASASAALAGRCGQLLVVGFPGTTAHEELRQRVETSEVGAVMLFRPNIAEPAQVAALVRELRLAAPPEAPLLVAVDQEGGLVQRLREPGTRWPDMLAVGAGPADRTLAIGHALGAELAVLGIGWDFAPVLDVHTNPENPVIGSRAFGTTVERVNDQALAFWRGLGRAGILGCGKHFPGHGDTRSDSHLELPVVEHDEARLRAVELAPFVAAIRGGCEALMTAHVRYPAWDPIWPATLSERIVGGILRRELGFDGLVVSDDLGMQAVAAAWSIEEIVLRGLMAGVDGFLIRQPEARQRAAHHALVAAAERDAEIRARVEQSAARMAAFKAKARGGLPAAESAIRAVLGAPEHLALARAVAPLGAGMGHPQAGSQVTRDS